MPKLVSGPKLTQAQQRQVLHSYVYRLTIENGYPAKNPCRASVPAISDAQWLSEHAFYVNKDGSLTRNRHYAEPAFLAD